VKDFFLIASHVMYAGKQKCVGGFPNTLLLYVRMEVSDFVSNEKISSLKFSQHLNEPLPVTKDSKYPRFPVCGCVIYLKFVNFHCWK
jgi:hypothetical protein